MKNTDSNTEKKARVKRDRGVAEGQTTNNLVLPNKCQVLLLKGFLIHEKILILILRKKLG